MFSFFTSHEGNVKQETVVIDIASAERPRDILKAELSRRGISYQKLAELMNERGWKLNKASVDNRMSRGSFGADFFLDALKTIGCMDIVLGYVEGGPKRPLIDGR